MRVIFGGSSKLKFGIIIFKIIKLNELTKNYKQLHFYVKRVQIILILFYTLANFNN